MQFLNSHGKELPDQLKHLSEAISRVPAEYRKEVQEAFDALLPWAKKREELLDIISATTNRLELGLSGLKLDLTASEMRCKELESRLGNEEPESE